MRPTVGIAPLLGLALFGLAARPVAARGAQLWTDVPRSRSAASRGFVELAARARDAVVNVRGELGDGVAGVESDEEGGAGRTSIGTGFIINENGYLLTNEHVVRGVVDLRVRLFDGRELPACVAGADQPTDVALLKIEAKGHLPVLGLGDSAAVRVGEPVIAIGNPYGFGHSVTAGIVSAKDRVVDRPSQHDAAADQLYSFFIQTDASINLGNSGGPLIDATGAVVGINSAFWAGHPLQPAQGIGFAIPINVAKALVPRLAGTADARRAYLGVDAQPIDPQLEAALKLRSGRGALIASIEKASPAEAAGLEPGDVVVGWNGAEVATNEDLKIDAQLSAPGSRLKIAIVRDGKRIEREISLRPLATRELIPPHPSSCARPPEPVSASVDDFDVHEAPARAGGHGVAVSRVTDRSAAARAGLQVGDLVLRVGKAAIRTPDDLAKALGGYELGEPVPMLVRRTGFDFWMAFPRR